MIDAIKKWIAEEFRLLGLDTWAGEYHGPPDPHPCTSRDPRCAKLAERQAKLYAAMRRMKSHILDREEDAAVMAQRHTDVQATMAKAERMRAPTVRLVRRARG